MSIATHILLATDFSEAGEGAVAKAAELTRTLSAKLTVLHVHGLPPAYPGSPVPPVSSSILERESREFLEKLKQAQLADIDSITLASAEHLSPHGQFAITLNSRTST